MNTGKSMLNRIFFTTITVALFVFATNAAAQDASAASEKPATAIASCSNPVGTWINQMGSKLQITSINLSTGAIDGRYQTASGANGWYPLTGWMNIGPPDPAKDNARIISFSVNWGSNGSITSWTGICRGTGELRTLWNLGRANSSFEWDHILSGADQFRPI